MKKLFLSFLLILPISIYAQDWETTFPPDSNMFGLEGLSIGFEIALTSEDGYLLAGEIDLPTGAIRHYLRLAKTDQLGNLIWQHTYDEGDVAYDRVHLVKESSNQEIMLVGTKGEIPYFVKLDSSGNSIWEKNYESDTLHVIKSAMICPDGNYLLVGYAEGSGSDVKALLLKFDEEGNLIWKKTHPILGGGILLDVSLTNDDGFIASGNIDNKVALFKFTVDGNLTWSKSYEFSTIDFGFAVKETLDGGYIIGGRTIGISSNVPLLFKTDSVGNGEWIKSLTGNPVEQITDIILKSDGNYIAVGSLLEFWSGPQNGFIVEINQLGEEVWSSNFSSNNQQITSVKHTINDGYILAGATPEGMLLKKIDGTITSQKEIFNFSTIEVFPNPMNSQTTFSIKNSNLKNLQLQVFNVTGKMVREETHHDASFVFHKKNLLSGIYFYKINDGNVLLGNGKLVIE